MFSFFDIEFLDPIGSIFIRRQKQPAHVKKCTLLPILYYTLDNEYM